MSEIPDSNSQSNAREAQEADFNAVIDMLEAQGNNIEANKVRDLTRRQEEIAQRSAGDKKAFLDQWTQKDEQAILKELTNRPQLPHNPQFDAKRVGTKTIEAIKKMLKPAERSKPPSSPNIPKGPTPSGGK